MSTSDDERHIPTVTVDRFVVTRLGDRDAREAPKEGVRDPHAVALAFGGGPGSHWSGASEVLGAFGLQENSAVSVDALTRVLQGRHVSDAERVRSASRVKPRLKDAEQGQQDERVRGLVQSGGTLEAPGAVNDAWRAADPDGRRAIEQRLFEGAERSLLAFAPNERVAAALAVRVRGELEQSRLEVDWLAVGADNDGRVRSALEPRQLTAAGVRASAEAAAEPLRALMAPERAEVAQSSQQSPVLERDDVDASERVDRIPLADSASRYHRELSTVGVRELRLQGQEVREQQRFGDLSVADLRDGLQHLQPFVDFDRGLISTQGEREEWWHYHGEEAALVVGAEEELIARAQEEHRVRAVMELERRGDEAADPIGLIRGLRGEKLADQVERRATVLAAGFEGLSMEQLEGMGTKMRSEIQQRGGVRYAGSEQLSTATAVQFRRNMHNAELAQQLEAGQQVDAGQQLEASQQLEAGEQVEAGQPQVEVHQEQRALDGAGAGREM